MPMLPPCTYVVIKHLFLSVYQDKHNPSPVGEGKAAGTAAGVRLNTTKKTPKGVFTFPNLRLTGAASPNIHAPPIT